MGEVMFQGNLLKVACTMAKEAYALPYNYTPEDYNLVARYNDNEAKYRRQRKADPAIRRGLIGAGLGAAAGAGAGALLSKYTGSGIDKPALAGAALGAGLGVLSGARR